MLFEKVTVCKQIVDVFFRQHVSIGEQVAIGKQIGIGEQVITRYHGGFFLFWHFKNLAWE